MKLQRTIDSMLAYARKEKPEYLEAIFTASDIIMGINVDEVRTKSASIMFDKMSQTEAVKTVREAAGL